MIVFNNLLNGLIIASIAIPLIVILKAIGVKRIYPKLYSIKNPLIDFIKPVGRRRIRDIVLDILFLAITIMLILAYMDPYYTYTEKNVVEKRGVGELSFKTKPATILIIDVSGSMGGEKIETAKRALIEFIKEINGTHDIGLIAFDGYIVETIPPTSNYNLLYEKIRELKASGGTMYSYPLRLAYTWLKPYRDFNINVSVVFASDGIPADWNIASSIVDKYAKNKIRIYGVFIGHTQMGYDLIKEMSKKTGGKAYLADDISKLVDLYKEIASTIKNTTLTNITVKMHYEKTVTHRVSLAGYILLATIPLILLLNYYTYRMYRVTF